MNGIYIHIPFCKKVCYYCDFHFTVSLKNKDRLLDAITCEIADRDQYFENNQVDTIYIGGGTPSILSPSELERILKQIRDHFRIVSNAEITMEVNPDDITKSYLENLKKLGINRLSIGIQSFFDDDLKWMNRRHSAEDAEKSVKLSQDAGFCNLNIDLIYGIPIDSIRHWTENLKKFSELNIPHLSAYHLTIEPKTIFGYYKKKGILVDIDEEKSVELYSILTNEMRTLGYHHYEISNFCADGFYSRHNLNYWQQGYYLGIGPSAHSYDGKVRRWNVRVNTRYMDAVEQNGIYFDEELLTDADRFNDYLLTGLRTSWGITKLSIGQLFGEKFLIHLESELLNFNNSDSLINTSERVTLTEKGMFLSDKIISSLFWV